MTQKIKNIIFDFGGVIIPINYHLCGKALELFGYHDFNKLFNQASQHHLFDEFEKGHISPEIFRQNMRELTGLSLSDREIDEVWNAMILDYSDEHIALLKKVKTHYRIFLLSNSNQIHYNKFFPEFCRNYGFSAFDELFDKAYFSHEMHQRKPDPEVFLTVLKEQGLLADETLFIDDSIQHVKSAAQLGIHTHFLDPAKGERTPDLFDENGQLLYF